jgi:hypothetical protein
MTTPLSAEGVFEGNLDALFFLDEDFEAMGSMNYVT